MDFITFLLFEAFIEIFVIVFLIFLFEFFTPLGHDPQYFRIFYFNVSVFNFLLGEIWSVFIDLSSDEVFRVFLYLRPVLLFLFVGLP